MSTTPIPLTATELDEMHSLYRQGGQERHMAPHIVYADAACPHTGCVQRMQAIDFRLKAHGKNIHHPLVRAWWDDTGFAGRCPGCHRWIRFTIQAKRAITREEAAQLPQLPDDWHVVRIIV